MDNEGLLQLRFDTGPELLLTSALEKARINGGRTQISIDGVTPTFSWPEKKVALFVDDCLRHRCPKHYKKESWRKAMENDAKEDDRQARKLGEKGWAIIHTFECEVSTPEGALGVAKFIGTAGMNARKARHGS